jgi:hypothetical protein
VQRARRSASAALGGPPLARPSPACVQIAGAEATGPNNRGEETGPLFRRRESGPVIAVSAGEASDGLLVGPRRAPGAARLARRRVPLRSSPDR